MAAFAMACSRMCASSFGGRFAPSSLRMNIGAVSQIQLLTSSQQSTGKVDKSLLSKLRKETGFGFAKCMESLQLNNNDYSAALMWLEAEAEKEGWEKATKLQGRTVSEGLVGVLVDSNFAAMVEVNCETDFVARNELFVDLVSNIANTAMLKRKKIVDQNQKINAFGGQLEHLREVIPEYKLRNEKIQNSNGETVGDSVNRTIGKLGENIKINRVVTLTTEETNVIGRYVHGSFVSSSGGCSLGRFGGIVALKPKHNEVNVDSMLSLANKLAQHVVGMNPLVISEEYREDEETEKSDISDALLEQDYLLDEKMTVKDLLEKEQVEVVDFVRYECGV